MRLPIFDIDAPSADLTSYRSVSSPAPLIQRVDHAAPSVFRPENMLREARRQKGLASGRVPRICILDPDGDMVDMVKAERGAERSPHWACYHTQMWEWEEDGLCFGIVGCVVGGSFAVMVAEQLFVSGCALLISVASAGRISGTLPPPYHILIDRCLRDEGTSYHYLPPSPYVTANPDLIRLAEDTFTRTGCAVLRGTSWTTDAPFRETEEAIERSRRDGLLAVEMEAAALYALARAKNYPIVCLAHVTNLLGCVEGDFEKGVQNGARDSLHLVTALAASWAHQDATAQKSAAE